MKKQDMISFYDEKTRKVLAYISVDGLVDGEIKETIALLSHEKNIPISQIKCKLNPEVR